MKPKSVSALVYKVVDIDKTVAFYESLGFRIADNDGHIAKAYLNWFSLEFHLAGDIDDGPKDGPMVLVSVDLDEFHQAAVAAGHKVVYGPEKTFGGRREFALRDPNGYLMVFFEKK
jgi:catechol 2,3-dioxygenase-like lactoylglutathione lyase family enzyme